MRLQRKDAGLSGDMDRLPQLVRLLFLLQKELRMGEIMGEIKRMLGESNDSV